MRLLLFLLLSFFFFSSPVSAIAAPAAGSGLLAIQPIKPVASENLTAVSPALAPPAKAGKLIKSFLLALIFPPFIMIGLLIALSKFSLPELPFNNIPNFGLAKRIRRMKFLMAMLLIISLAAFGLSIYFLFSSITLGLLIHAGNFILAVFSALIFGLWTKKLVHKLVSAMNPTNIKAR